MAKNYGIDDEVLANQIATTAATSSSSSSRSELFAKVVDASEKAMEEYSQKFAPSPSGPACSNPKIDTHVCRGIACLQKFVVDILYEVDWISILLNLLVLFAVIALIWVSYRMCLIVKDAGRTFYDFVSASYEDDEYSDGKNRARTNQQRRGPPTSAQNNTSLRRGGNARMHGMYSTSPVVMYTT